MGKRYILDLVPGMILSKTIFSPTGQVLLEEGQELGVEEINALLNWGIEYIWVMSDESPDAPYLMDLQKRDAKKQRMDHFKQNIFLLESNLESCADSGTVDMGSIHSIVATIFSDLIHDRDITISTLNSTKSENYLSTHMINVSTLAMMIGNRMQLPDSEISILGQGGLLHDMGMHLIPENIWNHDRLFNEQQLTEVRKHVKLGVDALKKAGVPAPVLRIIELHHERLDATGYPKGVKEDEIPLLARILAVADVYDALTSPRPYRKPMDSNAALRIIISDEGKKYDQKVLKMFLSDMAVYPIGCVVKLNTGETGVVVGTNPFHPFRPVVKLIFDSDNKEILPFQRLDLDLREHWKFYITEVRCQSCLDNCSITIPDDLY